MTIGLNAGNNIVLASNGAFTQSGTLTVTSPDLVIDTTGKNAGALLSQLLSSPGSNGITIQDRSVINNSAFSPSGNSNPIKFGGTLAANNSIVLLLANKGAITGGSSGSPTIDVKALGVSGTGNLASLFGSIGGSATTAAAANGRINPVPDNNYRFNDCVIGSVTCVVLPGLTPIQPQAAREVDVLVARPAEEDIDAPLINIFDEERLCEQVLRGGSGTGEGGVPMIRRCWLVAAVVAGALFGCQSPPPEAFVSSTDKGATHSAVPIGNDETGEPCRYQLVSGEGAGWRRGARRSSIASLGSSRAAMLPNWPKRPTRHGSMRSRDRDPGAPISTSASPVMPRCKRTFSAARRPC